MILLFAISPFGIAGLTAVFALGFVMFIVRRNTSIRKMAKLKEEAATLDYLLKEAYKHHVELKEGHNHIMSIMMDAIDDNIRLFKDNLALRKKYEHEDGEEG